MHTAVQEQVLGLVRQRIDVRARVLRHDHNPGRTCPRLGRAPCMVPVQKIVEPRCVSRMGWRAGVTGLLEIEDSGRSECLGEAHSL